MANRDCTANLTLLIGLFLFFSSLSLTKGEKNRKEAVHGRRRGSEEMTAADEELVAPEPTNGGVRSSSSRSKAALVAMMLPASMVLVQLFSILLVLLFKLALNTGMRPFVLLAYRNLIGAAAVAPLAHIFER